MKVHGRIGNRLSILAGTLIPLSLLFSSALAQEETIYDRLNRVKYLYLSGEYEDALRELKAIEPALPVMEQAEKLDFHVYKASTLAAFDRLDEAREAFKQALLLDPNLTLDKARFSPKIIRLFNDAKAALPFGMLSLRCDSFGASVYLDDSLIGTTPIGSIVGNLLAGEHTLKVTKPGYADWVQKVAIAKDQLTQVEVKMVVVMKPVQKTPAVAAPAPVPAPPPPLVPPAPEVKLTPRAEAPLPPPAIKERPPKPSVKGRTWAWVTLGGGALLAGGAGVFAALGSSSYEKYQNSNTQSDADRYKTETIHNDWTAVGFGVGALVSWGVSTYLFVSKPAPSSSAGIDVRLAVNPENPGIIAQVKF